jgi:hypothetical protein
MRNRHPIDRLFDIRQQINQLQDEADVIRSGVIAGKIDPIGDDHTAEIVEYIARVITVGKAERVLDSQQFNEVVTTRKMKKLCIHPIGQGIDP